MNAVEEMEKSILVPQSLHDMALSKSSSNPVPSGNGIALEKSLYEAFNALKNVKNVVLTGRLQLNLIFIDFITVSFKPRKWI